jgi:hypothetical protein
MQLPVVWLGPPTQFLEPDWLRDLLGPLDGEYEFVEDAHRDKMIPRALLVFRGAVDYTAYLQRYQQNRLPFGAIHLSDERLRDDCSFYDWDMCRFVFRNYWRPAQSAHAKVTTFGLGYKSGFWREYRGPTPAKVTVRERAYHWVFAGSTHANKRMIPLQTFQTVQPSRVHFNRFFNSPDGLPVTEYRDWLLDTKFGLCPAGHWNLDCFRLYEVLEAGAIPVTLSHTKVQPHQPSYWQLAFGRPAPFVHCNSWDECREEVQELLASPADCEERRVAVCQFWSEIKLGYQMKLCREIMMLMRN